MRELVDLWAYLAWVWTVIGALVYVLWRRIREADRAHRMGLDHPAHGRDANASQS